MPTYNGLRIAMGLSAKTSFAEVSSSATVQAKLAQVYPAVDEIDPWVGALAEDREADSSVGELVGAILQDQFTRLIQGDPFFWKWDPDLQALGELGDFSADITRQEEVLGRPLWNADQVTMTKVIEDNTIHSNLNANAFKVL
jgi:Animal haem peroxidase